MKKSNNVIAITGATATGKSDLAIKLAEKFNSEIISADSRLVYKGFDIGTAKPLPYELNRVKHHCVDVITPVEDFSVSDFKNIAKNAMEELFSQNKIPVVAGGTGFYIKSLLEGLDIPKVEADEDFRQKMRKLAEEKGNDYLYNILKNKDEQISKKLHPNDVFRVIRALEVINKTGKPMSEVQQKTMPDYNVIYIFLDAKEREYLYNRINLRTDMMLEQGLVEEVENIIKKYGQTVSLTKTLGYKEVVSYFNKEISYEEMTELIKKIRETLPKDNSHGLEL